ncbi:MAG TPA: hypothetical protein VLB83_04425 [Candidatus Paceibacterota bacterium]|nr:hypothetical protein [Candidatus Paceibacterota bacterium]
MDLFLFIDTIDSIIQSYLAFFPESFIYDLPESIRRNHALITMLFGMCYTIYGLVVIALADTASKNTIPDFRRAIKAVAFGVFIVLLSPIGFELSTVALGLLLLYATYRVIRGLCLNLIAMRQFRHGDNPKIDDPGIS